MLKKRLWIAFTALTTVLLLVSQQGYSHHKPGHNNGSNGNGGGRSRGTGRGAGTGNGHTYSDLQDQIDNISLTQGPAGPAGPTGPTGPAGPATNECTAVLTQLGFTEGIELGVEVKDETFSGTGQALQTIGSCPTPYIRTGATCLASVSSGAALRQAGSDTINGVMYCRGLIGQLDSNLLRLRSYPICTKVDLVCD